MLLPPLVHQLSHLHILESYQRIIYNTECGKLSGRKEMYLHRYKRTSGYSSFCFTKCSYDNVCYLEHSFTYSEFQVSIALSCLRLSHGELKQTFETEPLVVIPVLDYWNCAWTYASGHGNIQTHLYISLPFQIFTYHCPWHILVAGLCLHKININLIQQRNLSSSVTLIS